MLRAENQGIRRFEHLYGSVGYLDVRWVADGEVRLNDMYERATDSTRQYWSASYLRLGRRVGASVGAAAARAEAGLPGPQVGAVGALEVQHTALVGQEVAPVVVAGAAVEAGAAVLVVLAAGARHPGPAADVGGGVEGQHAQARPEAGSTPAATSMS